MRFPRFAPYTPSNSNIPRKRSSPTRFQVISCTLLVETLCLHIVDFALKKFYRFTCKKRTPFPDAFFNQACFFASLLGDYQVAFLVDFSGIPQGFSRISTHNGPTLTLTHLYLVEFTASNAIPTRHVSLSSTNVNYLSLVCSLATYALYTLYEFPSHCLDCQNAWIRIGCRMDFSLQVVYPYTLTST